MKKIQVITIAILLLVLSINLLINFEKNGAKADTVVAVRDITENTNRDKN